MVAVAFILYGYIASKPVVFQLKEAVVFAPGTSVKFLASITAEGGSEGCS